MPPLCQRKDDILPLARHFVSKCAIRLGLPDLRLDATSLDCLLDYSWPGNVRELENAIEHAAVFCQESVILPRHFPMHILSKNRLRDKQELAETPPQSGRGRAGTHSTGSCRPLMETAGKRRKFSALAKPRSIGVWANRIMTENLKRLSRDRSVCLFCPDGQWGLTEPSSPPRDGFEFRDSFGWQCRVQNLSAETAERRSDRFKISRVHPCDDG